MAAGMTMYSLISTAIGNVAAFPFRALIPCTGRMVASRTIPLDDRRRAILAVTHRENPTVCPSSSHLIKQRLVPIRLPEAQVSRHIDQCESRTGDCARAAVGGIHDVAGGRV